MTKRLPWLAGLLAMILVGGYYALTETVTWVERTSPDSHIQRNPYSAAQDWLALRNQPSERILSAAALFPLPDIDTTLILDSRRGHLNEEQVRDLLEWVQQGGELIAEARPLPGFHEEEDATDQDWLDNDPLLYPLGITVWHSEEDDESLEEDLVTGMLDLLPTFAGNPIQYCLQSDNEELRSRCEQLVCDAPSQPAPLLLHADDQPPRRIQLYSKHVLWHDSWDEEDDAQEDPPTSTKRDASGREWPVAVTAYADNDYGSQLIQLELGEGQITVLTDLSLWHSDHLLYFDHAWLLAWLTGNQPVWFVRSVAMPPLLQWLWQRAPYLGSALLVLLVLWLWSRIPRRGPRQQLHQQQGHDYLQHLHASGYFQWRTGQYSALLKALREQAESRLRHYHPEREQALALAAKHLCVSSEQLQLALSQAPHNREQLTQQVSLLQALRSET